MTKEFLNTVFLLGGYDLEMVEIKKILQNEGCKVIDKHLSWGAKLSDYHEYLNDQERFAGIELTPDIDPPLHFIEIDHHNSKSNLPSSIEQVASMVSIELTRWQKLVAANDKGYIPGLQKAGATPEEIIEIRRLDRQAQGVTHKEEQQAIKDIKQVKDIKGVKIIKTKLKRFSPVVDRLMAPKTLVYSNETLCYYGLFAQSIANHFHDLVKKGIAYFGGGENGFFGIVEKRMDNDKIENMSLNTIPELINEYTEKQQNS